jgi:hypothetical protein
MAFGVPHLDHHSHFDGKCGLPWSSDSLICGFVQFPPDTGPYIDGLDELTAPHTNGPTTLGRGHTWPLTGWYRRCCSNDDIGSICRLRTACRHVARNAARS